MSKSKLTEKCDELRTYLTKYITETTFRLVSPERMAEKILKQTKGDLNIRFKVCKKGEYERWQLKIRFETFNRNWRKLRQCILVLQKIHK